MESHDGTIEAHSEGEGKGATFVVRLPLLAVRDDVVIAGDFGESRPTARMRTVPASSAFKRRLGGVTVLLVEDDVDARELIELSLLCEGASVITAGTADEARARLDGTVVDVIVSDLQLGGEDGLALMRSVRERADGNREVPAIAMTGFAGSDAHAEALSAGFVTHLPKPFELESLVALIASLSPRAALAAQ